MWTRGVSKSLTYSDTPDCLKRFLLIIMEVEYQTHARRQHIKHFPHIDAQFQFIGSLSPSEIVSESALPFLLSQQMINRIIDWGGIKTDEFSACLCRLSDSLFCAVYESSGSSLF